MVFYEPERLPDIDPDRMRQDMARAARTLMRIMDERTRDGYVFRTDMRLRPELVMLQKTMVQCEGVARQLDPKHDMWGAAAPVVERWMKRELGPEGRIRDLGEDLQRLHDAARQLPRAIDDWAEVGAMLKAGELKLGGSPRIRPWALRIAWLAAAAAAGAFAAQALF
jgi:ubiquinone biosynthesis protein